MKDNLKKSNIGYFSYKKFSCIKARRKFQSQTDIRINVS